jgi:hypothetical protein
MSGPRPSARSRRVLRDARLHPRELFGGRLALVPRLPFGGGHAVDQLARAGLVARKASLTDPVGEAVAAEPRNAHQVNVLRVGTMAQVANQTTKRGGGHGVIETVERVRICVGQTNNPCVARRP